MNVVTLIARILLGLLFTFAGVMLFVGNPPPQPGLAGEFFDVFFKSHWALFVGAVQVVLGALLLIDRFVPIALILLAAFLYNSLAFHITMMQSSLPVPIVVLALWLLVAWKYRSLFALIFAAKPVIPRS